MKIQPLGDRVLVEAIEAKDIVKGGIYIPDSAKEKPQEDPLDLLDTKKLIYR